MSVGASKIGIIVSSYFKGLTAGMDLAMCILSSWLF